MVFGDAVLDRQLGFSIASTEDVFAALVEGMRRCFGAGAAEKAAGLEGDRHPPAGGQTAAEKGASPQRMVLACDVDGVFTRDPARHPDAQRIAVVHAANEQEVLAAEKGTGALGDERPPQEEPVPDVTGRMAGKIRRLRGLAAQMPGAEIRIISGLIPGAVRDALLGTYAGGTIVK